MWCADILFFFFVVSLFVFEMPPQRKDRKRKHTKSRSETETGDTAAATANSHTGTNENSTRVDDTGTSGSSARVDDGSETAIPLTRNDIPVIVHDIAKQLQLRSAEASDTSSTGHTPLVPSMLILCSFVILFCVVDTPPRCPLGPLIIDTPGFQGPLSSPGSAVVVHWADMCAFVVSSGVPL